MLFVPLNTGAKLRALFAINVGGNLFTAFEDKMRPVPLASSDNQSRPADVEILALIDYTLGDTHISKIPVTRVIDPNSHVLYVFS